MVYLVNEGKELGEAVRKVPMKKTSRWSGHCGRTLRNVEDIVLWRYRHWNL